MMGLKHIALDEREMPTFEWKARPRFRGLYFDGIDDWVAFTKRGSELSSSKGFTWILVAKPRSADSWAYCGWQYTRLGISGGKHDFSVLTQYGLYSVRSDNTVKPNKVYFLATIWNAINDELVLWEDDDKYVTTDIPPDAYDNRTNYAFNFCKDGHGLPNYGNVVIYYFLAYNRPINDTEVKQIHSNPYNPPRDGLVVWLVPGLVDTSVSRWYSITGSAYSGTIYGATVVEEEGEVLVL